jgi:hypothetical protein
MATKRLKIYEKKVERRQSSVFPRHTGIAQRIGGLRFIAASFLLAPRVWTLDIACIATKIDRLVTS